MDIMVSAYATTESQQLIYKGFDDVGTLKKIMPSFLGSASTV